MATKRNNWSGLVVPACTAAFHMVLTMTETWTAPAVDRTQSPNVAPERSAAEALLDYFRETLRRRTPSALRQPACCPGRRSGAG